MVLPKYFLTDIQNFKKVKKRLKEKLLNILGEDSVAKWRLIFGI